MKNQAVKRRFEEKLCGRLRGRDGGQAAKLGRLPHPPLPPPLVSSL